MGGTAYRWQKNPSIITTVCFWEAELNDWPDSGGSWQGRLGRRHQRLVRHCRGLLISPVTHSQQVLFDGFHYDGCADDYWFLLFRGLQHGQQRLAGVWWSSVQQVLWSGRLPASLPQSLEVLTKWDTHTHTRTHSLSLNTTPWDFASYSSSPVADLHRGTLTKTMIRINTKWLGGGGWGSVVNAVFMQI